MDKLLTKELQEKFTLYETLLKKWQKSINLVAPSTLNSIYNRHILDSAELFPLLSNPEKEKLIDLGSGAGFPGLVMAMMGVRHVTLIESDQKKCAFLRTVSRETNTNVEIYNGRIEKYSQDNPASVDVITARGLASIIDILNFARILLKPKGYALLHKGKNHHLETHTFSKNALSREFIIKKTLSTSVEGVFLRAERLT